MTFIIMANHFKNCYHPNICIYMYIYTFDNNKNKDILNIEKKANLLTTGVEYLEAYSTLCLFNIINCAQARLSSFLHSLL